MAEKLAVKHEITICALVPLPGTIHVPPLHFLLQPSDERLENEDLASVASATYLVSS